MPILYNSGYVVRVTSWENDADNYKTKEICANDVDHASQIVQFARLFESCNDRKNPGIGNHYEPSMTDFYTIAETLSVFHKQHPDFLHNCGRTAPVPDIDLEDDDCTDDDVTDFVEAFMDIAHILGLSNGDFYTRVCDGISVLYFPADVVYEDVSAYYNS